jgi:hypothetical protein
MASIGTLSNLAEGQTRQRVLNGVGVIKTTIQVTLDPGERFIGYEDLQNPPGKYSVFLPHTHSPGRTALHNSSSAFATNAASAAVDVSAGPVSGGIHASGNIAADSGRTADLRVESTGQFIMISVRGGEDTCLCFGTRSSIELYAIIERVSAAKNASGLGMLVEKAQIGNNLLLEAELERNTILIRERNDLQSVLQAEALKKSDQEKKNLTHALDLLTERAQVANKLILDAESERNTILIRDRNGLQSILQAKALTQGSQTLITLFRDHDRNIFDELKWKEMFNVNVPSPHVSSEMLTFANKVFQKGNHWRLVYIPSAIGEHLLTPENFRQLANQRTNDRVEILPEVQEQQGNKQPHLPYWAFLTRNIVEGTRGLSYDDQLKIVRKLDPKAQAPTMLAAVVSIYTEFVQLMRTNFRGTENEANPATFTRCEEEIFRVDGKQLQKTHAVVGGIDEQTIHATLTWSGNSKGIGMAAMRIFQA